MRKYVADFETTTNEDDCRIWAWAVCEIGNIDNFKYGNSIEDFIDFCKKTENSILYFHNLKFDSSFIIWWLLKNGYEYKKDKKDIKDKGFCCLINEIGAFYSLEIYFTKNKKRVNKVEIYDSLKILNFSVEKIAKDFNLPIQKLSINYNEFRKKGHLLTDEEIAYIRNDVEIIARALEIMFKMNLKKKTIASNAFNNYKEFNSNFTNYFPELDLKIDENIRRSYKGGFTYLNPVYKEKEVGKGIVLDVNSLYPSVMLYEKIPIGNPIYYKGKYKEDKLYNLYIQVISCSFEIKKGMIPTIQIKNNLSFIPNEYLESSQGDIVTLTLTSIDLELFLKHYNVYNLTYDEGFKFKSVKGLFSNYITFWSNQKIQAKKDENGAKYLISKLMLNSLYGKFGTNPNIRTKKPYLDENEVLRFKFNEKEVGNTIYIPAATFITSYARRKTIETSQKIRDYTLKKYGKDYYIYSDTDSIHMLNMNEDELKNFIDIDDFKIGAWKLESTFKRAKFIRQKCYIEQSEDDKINSTVAGLPKNLSSIINFDNFKIGFTTEDYKKQVDKIGHKHRFKYVKGGVILVDTEFKIK